MTFEIATAGTADVRRISDWAADEQWNPGDSDPLVFECARMYTGGVPDLDQGGIFATTTLELG